MTKVCTKAGLSVVLFAAWFGLSGIGAASAASVMKQCGDEWKAAKAAGTTNGQTWKDFLASCRAQKEGSAAPATTTPAAATPAAATPAAPAPAASLQGPAAPAAPTPQPMKPAAKPAPVKAAVASTGAGQFASEAEAKGRCPSDTVVWVNLKSHKYHYAGHRSYGTTKQGAYMCEADATAAGDVAAKGEKPKS